MKETESHPRLLVLMAVLTAILVILAGLNVARLWGVADRAAQNSAHSALWTEVNDQLHAREVTGEFPTGLEELPLTFPDNGSPDLLKRIDYRREEAGCRVSTTLRGQRLEQRYGQRPLD